jgi:hypothetical protein
MPVNEKIKKDHEKKKASISNNTLSLVAAHRNSPQINNSQQKTIDSMTEEEMNEFCKKPFQIEQV